MKWLNLVPEELTWIHAMVTQLFRRCFLFCHNLLSCDQKRIWITQIKFKVITAFVFLRLNGNRNKECKKAKQIKNNFTLNPQMELCTFSSLGCHPSYFYTLSFHSTLHLYGCSSLNVFSVTLQHSSNPFRVGSIVIISTLCGNSKNIWLGHQPVQMRHEPIRNDTGRGLPVQPEHSP